jgi:dTDP-4-dehydrorhamnose 3,5-epimerase-like enzyme
MNFKEFLQKEEFSQKDIPRLAKNANLNISKFDKKQLVMGLNVEKEHDKDKDTDVVKKDSDILKIAVAHLREKPNYYTKLKKVENE